MPVWRAAQLAHQCVHDALLVGRAPVGDRADDRTLLLEQRRDRLVDRARGEQVGHVDGVLLADAMAAVLGLIVLGRRPVELQEDHVGGACQRQALAGDLDRADDQLVLGVVGVRLERLHSGVAGAMAVLAEDVQRARKALEQRPLDLAMVGEHDQPLAR